MATKLASQEISDLDPYKFMTVIGTRVIRPGCRASTTALLSRAKITAPAQVLDVGCGGHDRDRDCPPTRHPGHSGGHLPADAANQLQELPAG